MKLEIASQRTRRPRAANGMLQLCLLAVLSGCSGRESSTPNRLGQLIHTNPPYTLKGLGSAIMGFADDYNTKVIQACSDVEAASGDQQTRVLMLQDKVATVNATVTIATAPNPVVAMLDMLVYVSLKRAVLEEAATTGPDAQALANMYAVLQQGEEEMWRIASSILTPEEQEEVRELLRRWRQDHPRQRYVSHIRFAEFDRYRLETTRDRAPRPWSVFQLLYLDPLAGADPMAQEIYEARLFAERIYYHLARMPGVLRWQVELLFEELALKPESRQALADLTNLTKIGERMATTAEGLVPALRREIDGAVRNAREELATERQAALEQLVAILRSERETILNALNTQSEALRPLATDVKSVLDSGTHMAVAVDGGVKSLDGFVGRFVPATAPGAEAREALVGASSPAPATADRPFDVLDYGKAASQIRDAATELRGLIAEVDRTLADPGGRDAAGLRKAAADVEDAANALLRRAFLYAGGLALVVLVLLPLSWRLASRPAPPKPREP